MIQFNKLNFPYAFPYYDLRWENSNYLAIICNIVLYFKFNRNETASNPTYITARYQSWPLFIYSVYFGSIFSPFRGKKDQQYRLLPTKSRITERIGSNTVHYGWIWLSIFLRISVFFHGVHIVSGEYLLPNAMVTLPKSRLLGGRAASF